MIFQPNRLLQLSGSKIIFLLFLTIFVSCFSTKKSTKRSGRSSRGRGDVVRKVPKPKPDTVQLKIEENPRVITDDTPLAGDLLPESIKKDRYRVSFLIPFKADRALNSGSDEFSAYERRFINFYAGVKLGLEELIKEGVSLDVDVYDSRSEMTEVKKLANLSKINQSDIIVGPYDKEALKWITQWAKDRQITVVSPWISSTSITDDNPYYIQTKPGLLKHYETMLFQAQQQNPDSEIHLVIKEGDDRKLRYMSYTLDNIGGDVENPPYDVIELSPDTLTYGQTAFVDTTFFQADDCDKVFVVPYASSRDAVFVYDFLRKLQIEKRECNTTVYGMYKWLDYQDEMFDLINAMDVRITISNLANPEDSNVKYFKRQYINRFGELPTDDALEGYDLILFLGKKLKEHGSRFQFVMDDKDVSTGTQTVFDLQPERDEESGKIQFYENRFLDLIKIEDFKYQRATD